MKKVYTMVGLLVVLAQTGLAQNKQPDPSAAGTQTPAQSENGLRLSVNPVTPSAATFSRTGQPRRVIGRLRAGEGLLVEVPAVNPFMHEVLIQGQAFKYELAEPVVGGGAPATVKAGEKAKADSGAVIPKKKPGGLGKKNSPKEKLTALNARLDSYLDVLEQLRLAYGSSTWPTPRVQGWLNTLDAGAKQAFSTAAPSARQVAATPAALAQDLKQQRQAVAGEIAKLEAELKSLPDKRKRTPAQQVRAEELPGELAKEKAASLEISPDFDAFEQRLTQEVGAAATVSATPDPELLLLGRVYAALRERGQNPGQTASKRIAADGDELDLTVTLKPLASYQLPPAAVPAQTFTYTRTLPVTRRFRVSVSAGVFVSQLVNHRFSLFEDSVRAGRRALPARVAPDTTTVPNYRRMKRIERENTLDKWDVGITTLTHFHYRLFPAFDVAASVGVGVQTSGIRAMAGGTLLFGGKEQRLCLTYGGVIGPVTRLSGGYAEGDKVSTSISVVPTQSVNRTSWFVAASWNLTGTRK